MKQFQIPQQSFLSLSTNYNLTFLKIKQQKRDFTISFVLGYYGYIQSPDIFCWFFIKQRKGRLVSLAHSGRASNSHADGCRLESHIRIWYRLHPIPEKQAPLYTINIMVIKNVLMCMRQDWLNFKTRSTSVYTKCLRPYIVFLRLPQHEKQDTNCLTLLYYMVWYL